MLDVVAAIIFELFIPLVRDVLLGGIGYGVRRAYYFLSGVPYQKIKTHRLNNQGFDNSIVGVVTVAFIMFLCVMI